MEVKVEEGKVRQRENIERDIIEMQSKEAKGGEE